MSRDTYHLIHKALQCEIGINAWKQNHLYCGQGMIQLDNCGLEEETILLVNIHQAAGETSHTVSLMKLYICFLL